jgi:phosphoribosyl 1,2-cyclic phosphodiesterase
MESGALSIVTVSVLASSSSGNCTLVRTSRTSILVDAGLSRKETNARLQSLGLDLSGIDAILITHEHADHVGGLPVIAKERDGRQIPIYISRLTAPSIAWGDCVPRIDMFQAGASFTIGDIDVTSFTIPHDAVDPVGFSFRAEGIKVSIATDLGYLPESVRFQLRGSDLLMLESNHDLNMLKVGPYPWSIKQRVMGRMGHLSNEAACEFLRNDIDSRTSTVILGHISEHNNHPVLVEQAACEVIRELYTRLIIAQPGRPTEAVIY